MSIHKLAATVLATLGVAGGVALGVAHAEHAQTRHADAATMVEYAAHHVDAATMVEYAISAHR
jgi:hypothetical protein